jgi:hypothetical protein
LACFLAALAIGPVAPPRAAAQTAPRLYLLSGTPASALSVGYPSVLYTLGSNQRLEALRTVCSGLFDLRDDGAGTLYLINRGQTKLYLVHEDRPATPDEIDSPYLDIRGAADSGWFNFYYAGWGVVAGPQVAPSAVLPYFKDTWHILRALPHAAEGIKRLTTGTGDLYQHFRYTGPGGGPYRYPAPGANVADDELTMPEVLSNKAPWLLQTLPAKLLSPDAGKYSMEVESRSGNSIVTTRSAIVVADTRQLFALGIHPSPGQRDYDVYVLWRPTGKWSSLDVRFIRFIPRTFGAWLAVIVEEPVHGRPSPGLENERAVSPKIRGSKVPNIRGAYPKDEYMPGEIDLYNLQDGRRIVLKTGQQDSEVLNVSSSQVLYRVNDAIFSARVDGSHIGPASLIARGPSVPEIHWVFWSNAAPQQ